MHVGTATLVRVQKATASSWVRPPWLVGFVERAIFFSEAMDHFEDSLKYRFRAGDKVLETHTSKTELHPE